MKLSEHFNESVLVLALDLDHFDGHRFLGGQTLGLDYGPIAALAEHLLNLIIVLAQCLPNLWQAQGFNSVARHHHLGLLGGIVALKLVGFHGFLARAIAI